MRAFALAVPNEDDESYSVAQPTNVTPLSRKLEVILREQNMTPARLAAVAGIGEGTVLSIIREDSPYKTNYLIAEYISEALGLTAGQIAWPNGVSHRGRPGGTGGTGGTGKLIGINHSPDVAAPVCELHWLELPSSGICGECTA